MCHNFLKIIFLKSKENVHYFGYVANLNYKVVETGN